MLVPFLIGIAAAYLTGFYALSALPWVVAGLGAALGIWALRSLPRGGAGQRLFAGIFLLFFLFLGYWRGVAGWPPNTSHHLSRQAALADSTQWVVAIERVTTSERNIRLTGRIRATSAGDSVAGRLLVYLPPVPAAAAVKVGDHLWLRGRPQPIEEPSNPYAFDAAAYYATQGLFHRLSPRDSTDWRPLPTSERSLYAVAQSLRRRAERQLQRTLDGDELAVAAALILGKKDRLSLALRSTYADTGAMHVLAVSGLHVGIVGQFVFWLLGGAIGRRRWGRWLRLALTLTAIWSFALLTGLAPSVQRSALMFSLFYAGQILFRRRTNGYNSLACAAFILLMVDPLQLFTVSFQLSFTAVAGILFFQRPLARLLYFRQRVGRYFWELSCVGIAAQLGTLPLTLYYFHQFPLYFLLSGVPVVLGATAGLASGLGYLALAGVPGIGALLGGLLGGVIGIQNAFLAALQRLPGAVIDAVWIPLPQVPLLYLLIALFGAGLVYHRRYWRYLLWGLILLGCWRAVIRWNQHDQELLIVYDLYRESALDYVRGQNAITLRSLPAGSVAEQYASENWRAARHYSIAKNWSLPAAGAPAKQSCGWRLGQRYLWILDRRAAAGPVPTNQALDYLWVRDNVWPSALPPLTADQISRVIVDGSNAPQTRSAWKRWGEENGVSVHVTADAGAYRWER
jgi:competence protein ComEC